MKTVVIFGTFFAFVQGASESIFTDEALDKTFERCVEETHLEVKARQYATSDVISEDDPELADFLVCLWKDSSIINDGTFDHSRVKIVFPIVIQRKYPDISNDDRPKLADAAVETCKGIAEEGHDLKMTTLKYRNCLIQYVVDNRKRTA